MVCRGPLTAARSYTTKISCLSDKELNRLQTSLQQAPEEMTLILPQENEQGGRDVDARPKSRTLALVMGWRSAKLAAVKKHASIYSKAGIPVVCANPTYWEACSPQEGERLTRSVLSSINTSLDSPVSLVLHTFCSGSNLLLPLITSDFESPERKLTRNLEPACAVFDSAPAHFSIRAAFNGHKAIYNSGGYTNFSFLAAFLKDIYVLIRFGRQRRKEIHSRTSFQSPMLSIPQLYLFSEADVVLSLPIVKAIVQEQRAMGRDVSSPTWKDANHVELFRTDHQTYRAQVYTLLKKCNLI